MTQPRIDPATVPGWAVDADPRNDPTYPMRDRSKENRPAADWPRPTPQATPIEVLQSVEYNDRPAVFGTSTPPSGVSGMMRRAAFRFSENDWWHWLLLLGADRVNMVEGLVEDLSRGHVPNIPAEIGVPAAWKHNKLGFGLRFAAISAGVAALAFALSSREEAPRRRGPVRRPPDRSRRPAPRFDGGSPGDVQAPRAV